MTDDEIGLLVGLGSIEATNAVGEEYGLPRLQNAVRAAASRPAVAAARKILRAAGHFLRRTDA